MMKTKIKKARVFVNAKFQREGSVLAETIQATSPGFETRLEIESDDDAEKIAAVVRNAENGCYVLQALLRPVPVVRQFTLNGNPFDPQTSKTKKEKRHG
jgi:uncharacterized OsmC-like protein